MSLPLWYQVILCTLHQEKTRWACFAENTSPIVHSCSVHSVAKRWGVDGQNSLSPHSTNNGCPVYSVHMYMGDKRTTSLSKPKFTALPNPRSPLPNPLLSHLPQLYHPPHCSTMFFYLYFTIYYCLLLLQLLFLPFYLIPSFLKQLKSLPSNNNKTLLFSFCSLNNKHLRAYHGPFTS